MAPFNVFLSLCVAIAVQQVSALTFVGMGANETHDTIYGRIFHQVSIRHIKIDTPFGAGHLCGGALIRLDLVVTTAQCVMTGSQKLPNDIFRVTGGNYDRTVKDESTYLGVVSRVIVHPQYSDIKQVNDIATLLLHNPVPKDFPNLKPISIHRKAPPSGSDKCFITGWGLTTANAKTYPNVLQMGQTNIMSLEKCEQMLGRKLTDSHICSDSSNTSASICKGDCGGPLLCQGYLVGLASFGVGCGKPDVPNVFTDIYSFRKWLEDNDARQMRPLGLLIFLSAAATIISLMAWRGPWRVT